jgi:hypothetical protein
MPVANLLMNSFVISSGELEYRICEIEFYHYHPKLYADPYAHRDPLQRDTLGKWYCHRSGLDITFGDGIAYNGILIRSILNENNGNYIYGPINLRKILFADIEDITTNNAFFLKPYNLSYEKIFKCRRYGLNRTRDTECYHDLKHRFYIKRKLKHPRIQ